MSTHPTKVLADDICAGNLPFEFTDLAGFRTPGITEISGVAELSGKEAGNGCEERYLDALRLVGELAKRRLSMPSLTIFDSRV